MTAELREVGQLPFYPLESSQRHGVLFGVVGWVEDLVHLPQNVLDFVGRDRPGEVLHIHPVAQDLSFLGGEKGFPQTGVVGFNLEVKLQHDLSVSGIVGFNPFLIS